MQLVAQIKCLTDPPAERLIVRPGKNPIPRKLPLFTHTSTLEDRFQ